MRPPCPPPRLQLLMRTYFRDYGLPHANKDTIAPLFRDELMPHEAAYIKAKSL
jgi:transposase-like protein